ncbi:hypothetical protein EJ06DRAFT_197999 [Trichodelitschia bisporula]|uniref:Uncharacterized protein n=1 Tax=Trichodelitschia bisporula TaxID=703511 RepID=A0A6G1I811_9PEZI|nr:hypothetical protein EJ06DRAFT_197999 [Trichodelitschia bisporula]
MTPITLTAAQARTTSHAIPTAAPASVQLGDEAHWIAWHIWHQYIMHEARSWNLDRYITGIDTVNMTEPEVQRLDSALRGWLYRSISDNVRDYIDMASVKPVAAPKLYSMIRSWFVKVVLGVSVPRAQKTSQQWAYPLRSSI